MGTEPCQPAGFYALDVGLGVASNIMLEEMQNQLFLCPRCRAGCCEPPDLLVWYQDVEGFYALDVGLGVARPFIIREVLEAEGVSMPSMSGWVLRAGGCRHGCREPSRFLCPRCRAGCCEAQGRRQVGAPPVSMPSMSGWVLRGDPRTARGPLGLRFYALDVGLGVARKTALRKALADPFLCPRCRAGCCEHRGRRDDHRHQGFYALDVGLGVARSTWRTTSVPREVSMPSMSGWVLRGRGAAAHSPSVTVSMPSMSGWVLRGMKRRKGKCTRRPVSMPSMSGWVLRGEDLHVRPAVPSGFLCPRCRAGCCEVPVLDGHRAYVFVSMPSMSGWVLRAT